MSPENQVTLFGVTLDSKLNFEAHIQKMSKSAIQKIKCISKNCQLLKGCSETSADELIFLF